MALNKTVLKDLIQSKITAIFPAGTVDFTGNPDKGIEAFADAIVTHLVNEGVSGSSSPALNNLDALGVYVGASSGSISPNYSSTIYITDGDDVTIAVGKLDAGLNLVSSSFAYETLDRVTDRGNITNNDITVNTITASSPGSQLKDTVVTGDLQVSGDIIGNITDTVFEDITVNTITANSSGSQFKDIAVDGDLQVSGDVEVNTIIATSSGSQLKDTAIDGDLQVSGDITVNTITATSSGSQFRDTMVSGSLDLANNKIINVNDPTNPQEVVTKIYADSIGPRHGFEISISDKTTLNFASGSRTFTLTHISDYKHYVDGIEYNNTGDVSITINDTEGVWYIYYDEDGVLTASQTLWDERIHMPVVIIYWDATNQKAIIIADERHTEVFSGEDHHYRHYVHGTKYSSGFGGTIYAVPNADKITIAIGSAHDEDIHIDVVDGIGDGLFEQDLSTTDAYSRLPVFYKDGSTAWRKFDATDHPFYDNAGVDRVYYNAESAGVWSITEAGNNKYVAYWVFVTNEKDEPIAVIMGQGNTEITLANAKANYTPESLDLGILPLREMKLLYRIIIRNNVIADITDYRTTTGTPVSSFVTNSHSSLADLGNDDHPQYLLTDGTRAVTGDFTVNGRISGSYFEAANSGSQFKDIAVAGNFQTSGDAYVGDNLYVGFSGPDNDYYLYFYNGGGPTGQYLKWDDVFPYFEFSNSLQVNGDITVDGTITVDTSGSWLRDTAINGDLQISGDIIGGISETLDSVCARGSEARTRSPYFEGVYAMPAPDDNYIRLHPGAYPNPPMLIFAMGAVTGSFYLDDYVPSFYMTKNLRLQQSALHVDGTIIASTSGSSFNNTVISGLDLNNNKITNVTDPTSDQDAATKKYADDVAVGGGTLDSVTTAGNVTSNDIVGGNLKASGSIYINADGGDGDSYLYFYEGSATGKSLKWDNDTHQFEFDDDVKLSGNVYISGSALGVVLNADNKPIITRAYEPFTAGNYAGIGRWGLFKESVTLVAGIPDVAGRYFKVAKYAEDSSYTDLMQVDSGGELRITGNKLYINSDGPDGACWIFFYEGNNTGRSLKWSNAADKFEFDDSLNIIGDLTVSGNVTANNIKKSVWVQPHSTGETATLATNKDYYGAASVGSDSAEGGAYFSIPIPTDFTTLTKAVIVCISTETGNTMWSALVRNAADGESMIAHTDSIVDEVTGVTAIYMKELDVSAALSFIEAGDYIGLKFVRSGDSGSDTITTLHVLGLLLEYT